MKQTFLHAHPLWWSTVSPPQCVCALSPHSFLLSLCCSGAVLYLTASGKKHTEPRSQQLTSRYKGSRWREHRVPVLNTERLLHTAIHSGMERSWFQQDAWRSAAILSSLHLGSVWTFRGRPCLYERRGSRLKTVSACCPASISWRWVRLCFVPPSNACYSEDVIWFDRIYIRAALLYTSLY